MAFWNRKRSLLATDTAEIADACIWLQSNREAPFSELVVSIRQRGWPESYNRRDALEQSFGFFLCDRRVSGHVVDQLHRGQARTESIDSVRLIILEAHEEYFGLAISVHEHGIYADLKDTVQKRGKLAIKLQAALLERTGITSMAELTKGLFG